MKILEPGRPQRGWSAEMVCTGAGNGHGGCGARLLVEEPDLFKTESHARDETETYLTFACACCGVLTDLPEILARKAPTSAWRKRPAPPTPLTNAQRAEVERP